MNWTKRQRVLRGRPRGITGSTMVGLLGVGIASGIAWMLWRKQSRCSAKCKEAIGKDGTVPHTDYDAAAAIGRQTGGEVFDD